MFIKDLGIANYRSFNEEGIELEELKKINIFIGKNNSGKSNILKFFKFLSEVSPHLSNLSHIRQMRYKDSAGKDISKYKFLKTFEENFENQYNRNGKTPIITFTLNTDEIATFNQYIFEKHNNELRIKMDIFNYAMEIETEFKDAELIGIGEVKDTFNKRRKDFLQSAKCYLKDYSV